MSSQEGSQNDFKDWYLMNSQPTFCFWPIFNSWPYYQKDVNKPDNFEQQHSLKLSFTDIQRLHSDFVECESLFESKSYDILAVSDISLTFLKLKYLKHLLILKQC